MLNKGPIYLGDVYYLKNKRIYTGFALDLRKTMILVISSIYYKQINLGGILNAKNKYRYYNYLLDFIVKSRKIDKPGTRYAIDVLDVADDAVKMYIEVYLGKEVTLDPRALIDGILKDHIFNYTLFDNNVIEFDEDQDYNLTPEMVKNMYTCIALLTTEFYSIHSDIACDHLVDTIYNCLELRLCATTIKHPIKGCATKLIKEMYNNG